MVFAAYPSSSLAKGYDPLYSFSPLASLDGFSRSHGDDLYVMQLVVAATNQNALYRINKLPRIDSNAAYMDDNAFEITVYLIYLC